MGKKVYIFHTGSASIRFTKYLPRPDNITANAHQPELKAVKNGYDVPRSVLIKGGANVFQRVKKDDQFSFWTPKGFMTIVDEEDLVWLKAHPVFQTAVKGGFITISDIEMSVAKGVKNLNSADKAAPRTYGFYEARKKSGGHKTAADTFDIKTEKAKVNIQEQE